MATTAASAFSAILHAAATSHASSPSHLRPAGRFVRCISASACSATRLPAASEHAAAAELSELPTKCHTKSFLANADGCTADWHASAANAATNAAAATATANGPSADRHASISATTAAAVRAATTTIPTKRAPIRQILDPRFIQLPSTRSSATATVSS